MAWRVAKALLHLREQVNAKYPSRSKASDGTIGNAEHAARSSDHNPWVKDGDTGVVTGMDITHDPLSGLDSEHLAEALRNSRDPRLKYVISNRKIAAFDHQDFAWRPYNGANAHNHHCHISVKSDKAHYDNDGDWNLDNVVGVSKPLGVIHTVPLMVLSSGSKGPEVTQLQEKLNTAKMGPIEVDGEFGPATVEAVKKFQQAHGLTPDGKVGPYTWEKF